MVPIQKLELLIMYLGWSQSELSRRTGIRQQTISKMFGGSNPRTANSLRVAKRLQVTAEWLFSNTDWPPQPIPDWVHPDDRDHFKLGKPPPHLKALKNLTAALTEIAGRERKAASKTGTGKPQRRTGGGAAGAA